VAATDEVSNPMFAPYRSRVPLVRRIRSEMKRNWAHEPPLQAEAVCGTITPSLVSVRETPAAVRTRPSVLVTLAAIGLRDSRWSACLSASKTVRQALAAFVRSVPRRQVVSAA
jgi:hypothetical protein